MQEGGVEAARHQLPIANQQEIGRSGFLNLAARTEQHLIRLILGASGQGGAHRRGVIAARLDHAHLRRRARVLVVDEDAQRLHPAREVIPHRARQHQEHRLGRRRRGRADVRGGAEQDRPQIKRARCFRHRVPAPRDHRPHHVGREGGRRLGQDQLTGALAQALKVPIHAERMDRPVRMSKRLEAFETGAGIMQYVSGGTQRNRLDRLDLGLAPASVAVRSDGHVRGEHGTERRAGRLGLGLRSHTLRLRSHGNHLGMKIIAGCSSSSFKA